MNDDISVKNYLKNIVDEVFNSPEVERVFQDLNDKLLIEDIQNFRAGKMSEEEILRKKIICHICKAKDRGIPQEECYNPPLMTSQERLYQEEVLLDLLKQYDPNGVLVVFEERNSWITGFFDGGDTWLIGDGDDIVFEGANVYGWRLSQVALRDPLGFGLKCVEETFVGNALAQRIDSVEIN